MLKDLNISFQTLQHCLSLLSSGIFLNTTERPKLPFEDLLRFITLVFASHRVRQVNNKYGLNQNLTHVRFSIMFA